MAPSSCSNLPWPPCSVNIIHQYQIDDTPIRFTTPIPPLCNQAIQATLAISVITAPYSSPCFPTMNSPMLSSKLTALERKMCDKMMVLTSYFKDELQSLKKYCKTPLIDPLYISPPPQITASPKYVTQLPSRILEKIFVIEFVFSEVAEKLKMNCKVNSVTGTFKDFC